MNSKAVWIGLSLMVAACSGPAAAPSDGHGPVGKGDIAAADILKQRPDGNFDVTCKNGQTQVATIDQIRADQICLVATTSARPNGILDVTCTDGSQEVDSPDQLAAGLGCVKARHATFHFDDLYRAHYDQTNGTGSTGHRADVEIKVIDGQSGSKVSAVFIDEEDLAPPLTTVLTDLTDEASFGAVGTREENLDVVTVYTFVFSGIIAGDQVTETACSVDRQVYSNSDTDRAAAITTDHYYRVNGDGAEAPLH